MEKTYFYKDEKSEDLHLYLKWMKGDYSLDQIEDLDALIKNAQEKYKAKFDNWFAQYFKEA